MPYSYTPPSYSLPQQGQSPDSLGDSYTFRGGDPMELLNLAKKYGISVKDLINLNQNIKQDPSNVQAGTVIKLPQGATAQAQQQNQQQGQQYQQPASGVGSVAETNRLLGGNYFDPNTGSQTRPFSPTQNNQNQPSTGQNQDGSGNTTSGTDISTTGANYASTGNPVIDGIIAQLQSSNDSNAKMYVDMFTGFQKGLDKLVAMGQNINPAINITPETVAQFMTTAQANSDLFTPYATSQIDPYYQSQLAQAKQTFLTSVGYSAQQQTQMEQDLQKNYGQSLKDIGATEADKGFALSGERQKQETDLAYSTNRQIQTSRQALGQQTTQAAQGFASQYGGANVPMFQIPNAPEASAGSPMGSSTGTQPLYNLSDSVYQGLTGSQQYQEKTDISSRASQLESAFRQNAATQQQRNLVI